MRVAADWWFQGIFAGICEASHLKARFISKGQVRLDRDFASHNSLWTDTSMSKLIAGRQSSPAEQLSQIT